MIEHGHPHALGGLLGGLRGGHIGQIDTQREIIIEKEKKRLSLIG